MTPRPPRRTALLFLLALAGLQARADSEICWSEAAPLTLKHDELSAAMAGETWRGAHPSSKATAYRDSVQFVVELAPGDPAGRSASFVCTLYAPALVPLAPGFRPLEDACSNVPMLSVPVRLSAAALPDGSTAGADGAVYSSFSQVFVLAGTLEVLEVSPGLFEEGGRLRVRIDVPAGVVRSRDGSAEAAIAVSNLELDATFAPVPDCPASCGCYCPYDGWLPGGG